MQKTSRIAIALFALASLAAVAGPTGESAAGADTKAGVVDNPVLRVCADPYQLPFSDRDGQGYENKIAELFARKLGAKLQYTWFPQRMAFIRNTLTAENDDGTFKCDLILSMPSGVDMVATTRPYYTSTWMLAYVRGRGLDDVQVADDLGRVVEAGRKVKFGMTDQGPATTWAFRRGLMANMEPYIGMPADPAVDPNEERIRDLVDGKIDATTIWGPAGGYLREKYKGKADLVLLPLPDDPDNAENRFTYSVSMAVRHADKDLKKRIQTLIDENRDEITAILKSYGIPLVEEPK
ncbi:MAG: quinoprotein dehydrogenase-associated putative ABC transporter substrate-binding protein [Gammaproteobacteria bacterium]